MEEEKYTKQQIADYLKTFTAAAPLSWIINNIENGNNLEEWVKMMENEKSIRHNRS